MQIQNDSFDKYVMVAPGSDYGVAMWSDIKSIDNAVFLEYVIDTENTLLKLLHHIHFSFRLNSKIQLPAQSIWRGKYSLGKVDLAGKRICVIFTDISASRVDAGYLKKLHTFSNITLVLVLVNVVSTKEKIIRNRLPYFDRVFSFDKNDCEKNGFTYYPTFYSKKCLEKESQAITTDAFFIGVEKGNRHSLLKRIYTLINENEGNADFYLSGVRETRGRLPGIVYNKWLNYSDILERIQKTNCIVEIMGTGQSGLTLRAMEAIVYNKKLLTNNQTIKELPFYNSKYIQCFENIEDIDVDFITKRESIDYKYNGEFSPIHLLKVISDINK